MAGKVEIGKTFSFQNKMSEPTPWFLEAAENITIWLVALDQERHVHNKHYLIYFLIRLIDIHKTSK